jgi:hypothetical protein
MGKRKGTTGQTMIYKQAILWMGENGVAGENHRHS